MAMQQQMMAQQTGTAATATSTPVMPQQPQFMAMPGFMPPGMLPTGDQTQMPQGFMPMPMMYPQYPAANIQQNGTFPGKNQEK